MRQFLFYRCFTAIAPLAYWSAAAVHLVIQRLTGSLRQALEVISTRISTMLSASWARLKPPVTWGVMISAPPTEMSAAAQGRYVQPCRKAARCTAAANASPSTAVPPHIEPGTFLRRQPLGAEQMQCLRRAGRKLNATRSACGSASMLCATTQVQ